MAILGDDRGCRAVRTRRPARSAVVSGRMCITVPVSFVRRLGSDPHRADRPTPTQTPFDEHRRPSNGAPASGPSTASPASSWSTASASASRAERLIYRATRRRLSRRQRRRPHLRRPCQKLSSPGAPARRPSEPRCFDLTPTDEQQMMQRGLRRLRVRRSCARPRSQADAACAAPAGDPRARRTSSGSTMLGVPEELGGAFEERSAVTSVLVTEALAHGDMGLAVAVLAPAAVSTAIGLWGDADQQATYLPEFTGENAARRCARGARAAARSSTRSTLRDDGPPRRRRLRHRRRQGARPARRRRRALRDRRRARGLRPGAVHRRVDDRRRPRSRPSPRWASAPPAPASSSSRRFACPARRAARRRRRRGLRRVHPPRAGSPGARSPSAPPRPRSTT